MTYSICIFTIIILQVLDGYLLLLCLTRIPDVKINVVLSELVNILGKETAVIFVKLISITTISHLGLHVSIEGLVLIIIIYIVIIIRKLGRIFIK